MQPERDGIELRCFCSRRPLLAKFGMDPKSGEPWVHIKSWKGDRLIVEALIVSGIVKLKCRHCGKWNRVAIRRGEPALKENPGDPFGDLH